MDQHALNFGANDRAPLAAISPILELGAYEALWAQHGMTTKKLGLRLRRQPWKMKTTFHCECCGTSWQAHHQGTRLR